MLWAFYFDRSPKARKEYRCKDYDWLINFDQDESSAEDKKRIDHSCGKIRKGNLYTKVTGKWSGEFENYWARMDLQNLYDIV